MKIKRLLAVSLASLLLCSCSAKGNSSTVEKETTQASSTTEQTTAKATTTITTKAENSSDNNDKNGSLTCKSSAEIVADMGFGFNIGNSLDSQSGTVSDVLEHEAAWGNPVITQKLIDSIAAAGFTAVRIPTTWQDFISDDESYTISAEYLARVKEVVDYCYANDMYVILNTHHEDWLENENLIYNKEEIAQEIFAVWTQIADYFADYDQHLIFEGLNEPRLKGTDIEWTGNEESYEVINYYEQIFVNAVRGNSKGYNNERCLMITGYAASSSESIMSAISIPTYNGEAASNLIVSIHCYSPYDFCLSTAQQTFDPESSADTSAIDSVFEAIKSEFSDNNIPVVITETGATGKDDEQSRTSWATYMATKAAEYGVPIFLWDNGSQGTGSENHCYFDRSTGELVAEDFVNALMQAKAVTEWGCMLSSEEAETESLIGGEVLASYEDGLTSDDEWDASYICLSAKESYYSDESKIAIVFTGSGEPKMVLDSEQLSLWWMPVDADSIETAGDKKVAYFSSDSIKSVVESYGVTSYSQLRNMSFLSSGGTITTYEISMINNS
ncbi:MAG: glycoside hydrolase family 5 protein [Ruminococcus sp.]|nr:glycoside hydrolase family 5 protein [Ruminococcus sp.]